jgi:DNA-binding GntR family transcriptional regulator
VEHRQIIQSLAVGDTATAQQTNARHLELAREVIKTHLETIKK